jgi:site-specific recombinase XerD
MSCLMLQRTSQGYDVTSQSLLLKQGGRCVSVTGRLTERAVDRRQAHHGGGLSSHCPRHAHASHAIGATLPEVQATLGHGNIVTTSGYLRARPGSSSGLKLDPELFHR